MVLTDTSNCPGNLVIELFGPGGNSLGNVIDSTMIGQTLDYTITNLDDSSSCDGLMMIQDEKGPSLTCAPDTLYSCIDGVSNVEGPSVSDCQDVTVTFEDQILSRTPCEDTLEVILRRYVAIDVSGNTDTCFQEISIRASSLDSVSFPADVALDNAIQCTMPLDTAPVVTGWPLLEGLALDGAICGIRATYTDVIGETCGNTIKIRRLWIVTDECSTVTIDSVQIIETVDTFPPSLVLMDTLRLSAAHDECSMNVTLPEAAVTDLCETSFNFQVTGPFAPLFSNGGFAGEVEAGIYDIIYRITDRCNNLFRDTLVLIIEDASPPQAICKPEVVVPLNGDGIAWIPSSSLDQLSYDNCGDVYFKARRMDVSPDCQLENSDNLFSDKLYFCCDDFANSPVMIVFRVYDVDPGEDDIDDDALEGHYSDCMVSVIVQDKFLPSIICPSDLTVSCTFDFNPEDLSIFGHVVTDLADRDSICLTDPDNAIQSCLGINGYAEDNCTSDITSTGTIDIGMCQTGTIERIFTITDAGGNERSCIQNIEIVNFAPFYINRDDHTDPTDGVIWPRNFTNTCDLEDVEPENLPDSSAGPIIIDDACDQLGMNHKDEVFDFSLNGEACAKIVRTWRIMDWCQFDGSEFEAWTYQQTIVISNEIAPVITSDLTDKSVCTDSDDCSPGFIGLSITASDDCTPLASLRIRYAIDLHSDTDFDISGEGTNADGIYPVGDHVIVWTVLDRCGNEIREAQNFSILNCKKPTPYCEPEIITTLMPSVFDTDGNPTDGMAEMWASDFDKGSHHICGYHVTASFSSDPTDVNRMFTCADVGTQNLELWITDENGQQDFCITSITIQNNSNIPSCDGFQDDDPMATVAGAVGTTDDQDFPEVDITLQGSGLDIVQTSMAGEYSFPDMPFGGSYTVIPHYDDAAGNGLSTLDLVKIQKHLLGIEPFETAHKYIAADVNHSGSITVLDMIELRRLLLGDLSTFSNNNVWTFVDYSYVFDEIEDALSYEFKEDYEISPLVNDMMDVNFTAVKIGDIDNSRILPGLIETEDRTAGIINLEMRSAFLNKGNVASLDLYLDTHMQSIGYQLAFSYDSEMMEILSVTSGNKNFDESHYRLDNENGKLILSWNNNEAAWKTNLPMLKLKVKAKQTMRLAEVLEIDQNMLHSELYDVDEQTYALNIKYLDDNSRSLVSSKFIPNPFSDDTDLNFYLNKMLKVEIDIYDSSGKRVFNKRVQGEIGNNVINISGSAFEADGIYHCKISTRDEILTSKLMYIRK